MKYNPRACNALALLPGLAGRHPLGPVSHGQGFLACMYELQEMLKAVTGMQAVSLTSGRSTWHQPGDGNDVWLQSQGDSDSGRWRC